MGLDLALSKQMLQLVVVEIGDTDGLDFSFLIGFLQQTVACHVIAGGLVDVQQVDVVHTQNFQCLFHCIFFFIFGGPDLGGGEYILSCDTGLPHGTAHGTLVHVGIGGVDHLVAHL